MLKLDNIYMFKLLRKIFIKDYLNINDLKVRTSHIILASIIGFILNLILFILKLIFGILTFSMSLISDAINNLTDFISSICSFIGSKLALKPADKKHPYGHQRIEYVIGMIISIFIIISSVILFYNGVSKLIIKDESTIFSIASLIVLAASILVKFFMFFLYRNFSKAINSIALKADSLDSISDVIGSVVILLGALIQYFYPSLWYIDKILTLIIALFIFYSGIKILFETSSPLISDQIDINLINNIKKDILSCDNVKGVHDIRYHSYGKSSIFISCHLEIDGNLSTFKSHEIANFVEETINNKYKIELVTHVDPLHLNDKEIEYLNEIILKVIKDVNKDYEYHDLRIVIKNSKKVIRFDLVTPYTKKEDKEEIKKIIDKKFKTYNSNYILEINIEHDYE